MMRALSAMRGGVAIFHAATPHVLIVALRSESSCCLSSLSALAFGNRRGQKIQCDMSACVRHFWVARDDAFNRCPKSGAAFFARKFVSARIVAFAKMSGVRLAFHI